jgi:hypothetical protein
MRSYLLAAIVAVLATGCGDELLGPRVVVRNHSGRDLEGVLLSGTGFTTSIGLIAAGSSESATLHPIGESSLRVTFDVDGTPVDSGNQGYFENSSLYAIAVDIDSSFKVTVSVALERL